MRLNTLNFYSLLQIGESHINHCEDYLVFEEFGQDKMLCAVMDGCTMGNDSYFASTLTGKILRKIAKELNYKEFINKEAKKKSLENSLREIMAILFDNLKVLKNSLQLEKEEFLNTLILLVLDSSQNKGKALVVGDGLVCLNGELFDFDQNNIPDYLGYHLSENFNEWYNSQKQIVTIEEISDISISTDGIFTFKATGLSGNTYNIDPLDFLLKEKSDLNNKTMLKKKISLLENQYGLKPLDDLGIIRIIRIPDNNL